MPTLYRGYSGQVLQKYALKERAVVVGRDPTCEISLQGPGVSRRHCQFVLRSDGYYIEDLQSANGTLVNGQRILTKQRLNDGDKVVVMGHILTYRTADDPTAEAIRPSPTVGATSETKYPSTQQLDPKELQRRLNGLLKGEFGWDSAGEKDKPS